MALFDMMKRESGRLRVVAVCMAAGLMALLAGLWFVQIVQARRFENNLIKQSYRAVRIPAIRGRILDCNDIVLAKDVPRYDAILYLEDLQQQFRERYAQLMRHYSAEHPGPKPKSKATIPSAVRAKLQLEADCNVVSNITYRVSTTLEEPRVLNTNAFLRHYNDHPYVPFEIVPNLAPKQIALFAENLSGQPAIEVETEPVRDYPNKTLAAHVIGYVQSMDTTVGGDISFTMKDYQGRSGIEAAFDDDLRGQAGIKSVLVNSQNYRQSEIVETPNRPGDDLYLTLDATVERAAERALTGLRGAAVVEDVRNGDIVALVSSPTYDPNDFLHMTAAKMEELNDPKLRPQFDRAVTGAYPPASTFKIITGLACLEDGLDPNEEYDSPGYYQATPKSRPTGDEAPPGLYNFERAFYRSSNTYFIHYGRDRLEKILQMAQRFHIGEKTGIEIGTEAADHFPKPSDLGRSFPVSRGADMCIGQEITATPLEMTGVISVIANGGTLFRPRLASHLRDAETGEMSVVTEQGRIWDHVRINPQDLAIIRRAMVEDTENPEGTAYKEFHRGGAPILGAYRVAGKTGTAEVKSPNLPYRHITWFDSYAPYESPRYAVVVMVEDGAAGGKTCAPVAVEIYEALMKRGVSGGGALARN